MLLGLCDEQFNEDQLIVPAIRSLACLDLLSGFHVHTSDTLSLVKDQVQKFGVLTKVFVIICDYLNCVLISTHQDIRESEAYKDDKKLSFRWPKMHSLAHLVDSIRSKGVTPNYSTDSGEALHPQNRKYWSRSNKQSSAPEQVCYMIGF